MPYDLTNLPGNLLTDAYSMEAFEFEEPSGDFAGLFVPSRTLAVAGTSSVVLDRTAGRQGRGVRQPASCSQWVEAAYDSAWNALTAGYDWLAVCLWFKQLAASGQQGIGVSGAAGLSQWYIDLTGLGVVVVDSSDNGPTIESGVTPTVGRWHFVCAQVHYDGSGSGVDLKLNVDGVDYTTVTGSKAITPNFPTATKVSTTILNTNCDNQVVDQLLFWKSAVAPLDATSIAALYNYGAGITFAPSNAGRRLLRLHAAGII